MIFNKYIKSVLLMCVTANLFAFNLSIPPTLQQGLSVSIYDTSTNHYLYQYNSDKPRLIASNMKIVTSYLSLSSMGESYTFNTQLVSRSTPDSKGDIDGDVYLVGGGDPSFTTNDLNSLFAQLHNKKVSSISGDIVIDKSVFIGEMTSSEKNPNYFAAYSVNPSGFIINENLSNFVFTQDNNHLQLKIYPYNQPVAPTVKLTKPKYIDCLNHGGDLLKLKKSLNSQLEVSGYFPVQCMGYNYSYRVLDIDTYNLIVMRDMLAQNGIRLAGKIKLGNVNKHNFYPIRLVHRSSQLSELLVLMNHYSNNLYAKTLFLASAMSIQFLDSIRYLDACKIFENDLKSKMVANTMVAQNGSGLSRTERLTSDEMTELLLSIYNSKYYPVILSSLPSPGYPGTLSDSLLEFKDRLKVKTGTLGDAKNYSGYYVQNGHIYIVSFLLNTNLGIDNNLMLYKKLIENSLLQLN